MLHVIGSWASNTQGVGEFVDGLQASPAVRQLFMIPLPVASGKKAGEEEATAAMEVLASADGG